MKKRLSLRTRMRLWFWRVRMWVRHTFIWHGTTRFTRIRNALTGSITVTAIRTGEDHSGLFGESVYCVTRTADGKSLLIVHKDGTQTVIPFEELGAFLVTAY